MNHADTMDLLQRLGLAPRTTVAWTAVYLVEAGWTPERAPDGWRWRHTCLDGHGAATMRVAEEIQRAEDRRTGRRGER